LASGRAEENVYFGWFGGFAAKPTEKDGHFLAAAACPEPVEGAENAQCGATAQLLALPRLTRSPRVQAGIACGSMEKPFKFVLFCGKAAKSNEKDSSFHAAAACPEPVEGAKKPLRRKQNAPLRKSCHLFN
jgi:hypothetical protein